MFLTCQRVTDLNLHWCITTPDSTTVDNLTLIVGSVLTAVLQCLEYDIILTNLLTFLIPLR